MLVHGDSTVWFQKPWCFGPDGISDFAALYSGKRNDEVRLYAFDLLQDDGVDMREEKCESASCGLPSY
jgi:hypothetical protein